MKRPLGRLLMVLAMLLATAVAGAAEKIRPFEADSFKQIIASHQGKPFVVLVWSLDCDYCQPSFQALAAAQRKSRFAVVTIATDRIDDAETAGLIRKKLAGTGLNASNWAFGALPPEQLRYAIDPKWRGEMPRSYWFNARGDAVAHSGVLTAEVISKLLPK